MLITLLSMEQAAVARQVEDFWQWLQQVT